MSSSVSTAIKIAVETGTLTGELVSPDGQYLVLVFQNSQQFPNPCNCVVYNLEGEVHRIICAPYMVSEEVIRNHNNDRFIQGIIGGVSNYKVDNGEFYMVIGVRDPKQYDNTGVSYGEVRQFNPETGEISSLLKVSLPLR